MSLKRTSLSLQDYVVARPVVDPWPLCMTCGRPVDSEELVEGEPGETETAKILVRHHGAEELRTFNFGTRHWTAEHLARFTQRADWFDPRTEAGAVSITRNGAG